MYDTTDCRTCGQRLTLGAREHDCLSCRCAGGNGHRIIICDACRAEHHDPPNSGDMPGVGAGDYSTG